MISGRLYGLNKRFPEFVDCWFEVQGNQVGRRFRVCCYGCNFHIGDMAQVREALEGEVLPRGIQSEEVVQALFAVPFFFRSIYAEVLTVLHRGSHKLSLNWSVVGRGNKVS